MILPGKFSLTNIDKGVRKEKSLFIFGSSVNCITNIEIKMEISPKQNKTKPRSPKQ